MKETHKATSPDLASAATVRTRLNVEEPPQSQEPRLMEDLLASFPGPDHRCTPQRYGCQGWAEPDWSSARRTACRRSPGPGRVGIAFELWQHHYHARPTRDGQCRQWSLWQKSIRTQRRSSKTGYDQPPSMLLFVLYACLPLLIDLALAPLRDCAADQAELLVLRHQVRVLERHVKVVRWRQADRLVLAALARRLPSPS